MKRTEIAATSAADAVVAAAGAGRWMMYAIHLYNHSAFWARAGEHNVLAGWLLLFSSSSSLALLLARARIETEKSTRLRALCMYVVNVYLLHCIICMCEYKLYIRYMRERGLYFVYEYECDCLFRMPKIVRCHTPNHELKHTGENGLAQLHRHWCP